MDSPTVDAHGVIAFLERLGQCYRRPGVVYLVGGSSLLLVAAKASTFDIDLKYEVAPSDQVEFMRCLRRLSRQMSVSIEEAGPDDFIPLPRGYQERRQFIGRFANLDVFHFDFYSVALSKLHRGNEKDFIDVVTMVQTGVIDLNRLEQYYQEIFPLLEAHSLRANPDDFARKFALFKARLAATSA